MKSKFTNFYVKLSFYLTVFIGLSASNAFAQGFAGGKTYVVNGQVDQVAPIDTFVNLSGTGTSGAITYLNTFGIDVTQAQGTVTILLDQGYSGLEPSSIQVGATTGAGYPNMSATRPVVLKPNAGLSFTISTAAVIAANGSLFRIFGSTNFSIDGNSGNNQRSLTFSMGSSTTSTARVIDIIPASGAASNRIRNVSIMNCNVVGNSTATAINTYAGIYFGGSTSTPQNAAIGTNYNISYVNNLILAVQNGIYHRGFSTNSTAFPSQDTGVNVVNNIIGNYSNPINATNFAGIGGTSSNLSGIYLQTVSNSTISGNVIRNTLPISVANVNGGFAAIRLATDGNQLALDSNIRIVKNTIYNVFSNVASQGVSGIRISLGAHTTSRRLLVANNSIAEIASINGASSITSIGSYTSGILVDNATNYVGLEVYYNSVNLYDTMAAANSVSACFVVGTATNGGIRMMNNSYSNKFSNTGANISGYQNYAVVTAANNINPFSYSNFNNYYSNTFGSGYAFVAGVVRNGLIRNVSTLKNFRLYSRSDSNSFAVVSPFTNDSILTINNGVSSVLYNRGYVFASLSLFNKGVSDSIINRVGDDILGNPRTGLGKFTSIGCHQWNGDSSNIPSVLIAGSTYQINGVSNPPKISSPNSGSFANLSEAITHLNAYGITGNQNNVVLQISPNYQRETTWIPAIVDYPGSTPSLNVIIRPQVGHIDTIWSPNEINAANTSVLRFMGARNVILDGLLSSNNNSRNLTVMFNAKAVTPNARVIGIVPTDTSSQNITIKNINILGNTSTSAINTFAGIYYGHPFINSVPPSVNDTLRTVDNININIENNLIQGVRNGIYVRGSAANPQGSAATFATTALGVIVNSVKNIKVISNIIGGNIAPGGSLPTTFIGGAADQAGIYMAGVEAAVIDSNIIRNCLPTAALSNGFRGIDVVELSTKYPNFDVIISRNFIYNLVTATGASAIGIRTQFSAANGIIGGQSVGTRSYFMINNSVSNILSRGAGAAISLTNPTGILVDASTAVTGNNVLSLINNTINMSGNNYLNANSGITALYLGANIRGGVSSLNNIFGVTANRNNAGNMYSVCVLSSTTPFGRNSAFLLPESDFNSYFVSGSNPTLANNIIMATPSAAPTTRTNINSLREFTGRNIDLSSFNFPTRFENDTLPDLVTFTAGTRYTTGGSVSLVTNDIYGTSRGANMNIGAVKFALINSGLQPNAVYQINGSDNFPLQSNPTVGSFKNLRSAVNYLNAFGTGLSFTGYSPVRLEFSAGYIGETDSFVTPITVFDYPTANQSVPVIVSVAAGRKDTIRFTNFNSAPAANSSLIRISSGRYFGFDGSNNGSSSRDLTIVMPTIMNTSTYKIIDIVGGQSSVFSQSLSTSDNFVKNCNLIGNSTNSSINTFAAIYMGGISATPSNSIGLGGNNNNAFINNFIGGCQYGIYLRGNGVRGQGDLNTTINENVIGGIVAPGGTQVTDYFGGINNASGIFCVGQTQASISMNKIQNNIVGFSNPRGIELATIVGNTVLDSANIIDGNIINNIGSTVAASSAYGIYINFGSDRGNVVNSTKIQNNMISKIYGQGGTPYMSGIFGIAIDAVATFNDPNISINFNSINLGLANTLASNSRSACLAVSPRFPYDFSTTSSLGYGFKIYNNLFSNKLGGITGSTGVKARAISIGTTISPISNSDNNNYFCNATNAVNGLIVANDSTASPVNYNTWDSLYIYTGGDLFSSNFTVPFINDTNLFIAPSTTTVLYAAGRPISGIVSDVSLNTRNNIAPTIGAHEYPGGNSIDSLVPRILPMNSVTCLNSIFNQISFIIEDRYYTGDVLTYRINGGTSINLSGFDGGVTPGGYRIRNFNFPVSAFASGGVIEYKITANDIDGNSGVYPYNKPWDTLSTGLSTFPYTMNFEDGLQGWNTNTLTRGGFWNVGAFGSNANPSHATENGIRCALFPSSTLPAGASARLISPCFNMAAMGSAARPMLRFRFSQSNFIAAKRDSIIVRPIINGFPGPELKVVVRPNAQSPYPDWFTYEACLSEYRTPGNIYSFQFDAFSTGGGQNIMIDSIQIFDDAQNQTILPLASTICNASQPYKITIPNTDNRYVYRAIEVDKSGNGLSVLDTAFGNSSDLTLNFANRQMDTIRYIVSAINYGSETYQPIGSGVSPNYCSNNLPGGTLVAVINRFNRPTTAIGSYIIPDLSVGAFNGSVNDGDQFKPDAVKNGNSVRYEILSPTASYSNSSYGSAWTLLNTSIRSVESGNPATNVVFTAPTSTTNAKVSFVPTFAEGDTTFVLSTTLRFIGTNCDTTVFRYIKVANPIAYGFVTGPRVDTTCTSTPINFAVVQGDQSGGVTWSWNFGDGSTGNNSFKNPTYSFANAGTYRVRLTATSPLGIQDTVSRLITVLQGPSASYTASTAVIVCQSDSTFFNANDLGAGLTYLWNFPGNILRNSSKTSFFFQKADTNYAVSLKVTNPANGCFALNNRIFPSYAKPKAKFTVTSHCQGQFMPYVDSSSISNSDRLGYFWSFSTGEQRQSNNFQIKFSNSGTFKVTLRLTSAAGCEDTISKLVTVYETPKPNFLFTSACTNDSATFNNQTVYGAGIQNAGFIWNFGDNSGVDTRQDPKHRYLNNNSGEDFIVKLIASNLLYGCKDSVTKNVSIKSAPVAVAELGGTTKTGLTTDKICQGNKVTFTSKSFSNAGSTVTCTWIFGNGQNSDCNSFNTYDNPGVYNWSLTATADGCQDTKTGTINVLAKPVITYSKQSLGVIPGRFTIDNRKVFTPSDLASDLNSYSWNFGDIDSTTTNQRIADFTYNKKGTYKVRMQVTTSEGCIVSYTDTVNVFAGVSVGEELAAKYDLIAYPNPLTNNAFVSLNLIKTDDITITITDVLGREISSTSYLNTNAGKHNFELTSNNFNTAGTYFVKVKIGDTVIVKSLVKQ